MTRKISTVFASLLATVIAFYPTSIVLAGGASLCTEHLRENPCWVTRSHMPTARRELGLASDSTGRLYSVGGFNGAFLNTLEVYNPASDTWATKAPLPAPRNEMGFAFSPNTGTFFEAGGFANGVFNSVYEYTPASDSWLAKHSMLTSRYGLGLATSNGKLYAIGGGDSTGTLIAPVEEYNPATDSWTAKSAIPTPRTALGVITAPNGKIYAIGGHLDGAHGNLEMATVEQYDPVTDSWRTKAPMTTARSSIAVSLNAQGHIYAIGGNVGDPGSSPPVWTDVVEEYDPALDTWTTTTSIPVATMELGAALGGDGKVYAIGGWTPSSGAVNSNYAACLPKGHGVACPK